MEDRNRTLASQTSMYRVLWMLGLDRALVDFDALCLHAEMDQAVFAEKYWPDP
jgi:hypothetical protein